MYAFIIAVFKLGCVPAGAIALKCSVIWFNACNKNTLSSLSSIPSIASQPSWIHPSNVIILANPSDTPQFANIKLPAFTSLLFFTPSWIICSFVELRYILSPSVASPILIQGTSPPKNCSIGLGEPPLTMVQSSPNGSHSQCLSLILISPNISTNRALISSSSFWSSSFLAWITPYTLSNISENSICFSKEISGIIISSSTFRLIALNVLPVPLLFNSAFFPLSNQKINSGKAFDLSGVNAASPRPIQQFSLA